MAVGAATTSASSPEPARRPPVHPAAWSAALAVLALIIFTAGVAGVDAPWVLGDELDRIGAHLLVDPPPGLGHSPEPWARLAAAFAQPHGGMYEPLVVTSWVLQHALGAASVTAVRTLDLLLHATVAVLLATLLRPVLRANLGLGLAAAALAWALALLWAAHPLFAWTWAAGAGRGHLMTAIALLLTWRWHASALRPGRAAWFLAALAALLVAQLSRPVPGWLGVVLLLEAAVIGCTRVFLQTRIYIIACVCLAAALALAWSPVQTELPGHVPVASPDSTLPQALATIPPSFAALLGLVSLPPYYRPIPAELRSPHIWLGLALGLASLALAAYCWRRRRHPLVTCGLAWFWLLLIPELIHARGTPLDLARRLYLPSLGLVLALAAGFAAVLRAAAGRPRIHAGVAVAVAAAAFVTLAAGYPTIAVARSALARARRTLAAYPTDPRVLESAAAACEYAAGTPPAAGDAAFIPAGVPRCAHLRNEALDLLQRAAAAVLAAAHPDTNTRGRAHIRLAAGFARAGRPEDAVAQAEQAVELLPEDFDAWRVMAGALQAAGRAADAARAYTECERRLPADPAVRAAHFAAFGTLLMFELDRDDDACRRFQQALETTEPPLAARIGIAACHIRYGDGATGFQIVSAALDADPGNVQGGLVLAEYHLRSHHWDQARAVYEAILRDDPVNYAALRGFQEVALQTGRSRDAIIAWADAAARQPQRREFQSFHVWSLALANDPLTEAAARDVLARDPDNPLACMALMLMAARVDQPDQAIEWIRHAAAGRPIPKGREFDRAAAIVQLLLGRGSLPASAALVHAALYIESSPELHDHAARMLADFRAAHPDSPWNALAAELQRRIGSVDADAR